MSKLTVQGTLTDRGKSPAFPMPLHVSITLTRDDTHYTYTDAMDVRCPTSGKFTAEFSVASDVEAAFTVSGAPGSGSGTAGGRVAVHVETFVSGQKQLDYSSPVVAFFAKDQTFPSMASSLLDDLALDVNLNGLAHYAFKILMRDDDTTTQTAFKKVDQLTCELLHQSGRQVAGLVRSAPGDDGGPTNPAVDAAVDAFNKAILDGPDPGESEDDFEQKLNDLKNDINVAADPSVALPSGEFTVVATAPALRDGDDYTADILVAKSLVDDPDFFVRFYSGGPGLQDELVLRSIQLVTLPWPATTYGLISRVKQVTGIGTISKPLPDRTYQAPFVMIDPDLDIVTTGSGGNGNLRVRARIGVGTGANMVIATIASIDVTLALTLHDYSQVPFSMSELDEFFDLTIVNTAVDILPGTDLDELPTWVWVAIGVLGFPVGLSGVALTEATIAAIELAMRPVVRSLVQSQTVSALATQLHKDVNDQVNTELSDAAQDYGTTIAPDEQDVLRSHAWFAPDELEIDVDGVTVTGFGGVWDQVVQFLNQDCPLQSDAARRSVDLDQARTFEDTITTPDLTAWVTQYRRHRRELRRILATHPAVLAKAAAFVRAHHATVAGGDGVVIPASTLSDWQDVSNALRKSASAGLAALLTDVDGVMTASAGRTVAQARHIAATRPPTAAA